MEKAHNHNLTSLEHSKDKYSKTQLRKVFEALKVKPMTMLEVARVVGIERGNICWYIDDLFESHKIALLRKRKCTVSKHPKVGEYTTNPELFQKSNQLNFFE